MKLPRLNNRLLAIAELVDPGAVLADIGTDHAYLAIYLLSVGKIKRAVCTDIGISPLNRARENVEDNALSHLVDFYLADGIAPLPELNIDTYSICGMGGELIAEIIDTAGERLRRREITLILQPMSRPEALRRYLAEHGFSIVTERYVTDGGKHFVCMKARYTAIARTPDSFEAYFGNVAEFARGDSARAYLTEKHKSLLRRSRGMAQHGDDTAQLDSMIAALAEHISKL